MISRRVAEKNTKKTEKIKSDTEATLARTDELVKLAHQVHAEQIVKNNSWDTLLSKLKKAKNDFELNKTTATLNDYNNAYYVAHTYVEEKKKDKYKKNDPKNKTKTRETILLEHKVIIDKAQAELNKNKLPAAEEKKPTTIEAAKENQTRENQTPVPIQRQKTKKRIRPKDAAPLTNQETDKQTIPLIPPKKDSNWLSFFCCCRPSPQENEETIEQARAKRYT